MVWPAIANPVGTTSPKAISSLILLSSGGGELTQPATLIRSTRLRCESVTRSAPWYVSFAYVDPVATSISNPGLGGCATDHLPTSAITVKLFGPSTRYTPSMSFPPTRGFTSVISTYAVFTVERYVHG